MQILDWFIRYLLLPGILATILFLVPEELLKDIKEWRKVLAGDEDMVDEDLRAKMTQAFIDGRKQEALEMSKIIDIQVLEAVKSRQKNTRKSKIPSVATTEYRIPKENY